MKTLVQKRLRQAVCYLLLGSILLLGMTSCEFFKKKVPPQELFKQAEEHRKNENFVEAAQLYDELIKQHEKSELVPPAPVLFRDL